MEKKQASTKKSDIEKKVTPKTNAAGELREFFIEALKDIYWAEKALTKALPKMHINASSDKLKTAIHDHLVQTEDHVKRLEEIFSSIGEKAVAKKCEAMDGLLKEGDSILEETKPGAVRDAGIIAAAQKVEHYEIATYGTLAAFAKVLDEKTALKNLLKTLGEEKKADQLLSAIADTNLNSKAISGSNKN